MNLEESWKTKEDRYKIFDDQILSNEAHNKVEIRLGFIPFSKTSGLLLDYGFLEVY